MAALPYVLLYLVLCTASALVATYAWRLRYYRSGRPFALLFAALAFWTGSRLLSIVEPTFEGTTFWALLQVGGIVLVMPTWLMVALSYSGRRWRRQARLVAALYLPAALFLVLALTNSLHGLWWRSVVPDLSRGFMWLSLEYGPAFWIHSIYAYACFVASVSLLLQIALTAPPIERRPAWLMIGASTLPVAGNLAYLAGIRSPWVDDPTPVVLFFGALLALYATVHFRVVDLTPLAGREAMLALPDGMVVIDNNGETIELNDEAARQLGVQDWTQGQPFAELLAGSPLGPSLRPVLSGLGVPQTHDVRYEAANGQRTVEVRTRPLLAANGVISGALVLLRDVSERARAEQARAQHLAELSLIMRVARATNTAPDAASLVRAAAAIIGEAGLWERVAVGLLTPDGARLAVIADVVVDGGGSSFEGALLDISANFDFVSSLRAGGSTIVDLNEPAVATTPIGAALASVGLRRLLIVPLFHQGSLLGLLALGSLEGVIASPALPRVAETIGELITDAVMRAQLYDEARQADQLKASFLASVSHELRTPLTSIIGYVEMMQRGVYGPPSELMAESLGYMRVASTSLLRMINDLLDFSRAEAGHLRVDLTPVDLLHVAANVVGQLRPQIAERGLDFELRIPPGLPLARGNQSRLEQVLTNLLGNAIKFTDKGRVVVSACRHGDRLRLSVEDSGIGIAPENLELIFQEFRRVETPGRRVGGTGLGLAISRRLVELMGGTLSVASEAGRGSTFTVEVAAIERATLERPEVVAVAGVDRGA